MLIQSCCWWGDAGLGVGLVSWSLILDGQYVLFQVEDTPRPQRQQEQSLRSMWLEYLDGMRNMEQDGSRARPKTHSPSPPPPQQRRPPNLVLPPLPSRAGASAVGGGRVGAGAAAAVAVRAGSGEKAEGASGAQGLRTSPSAASRGSARRSLFSNEVAPVVPARGDEGGQVRT